MADFNLSFAITAKYEGLYANNPNDPGLETYAGISRKYWPNWLGWKKIDAIKTQFGKTEKVINQKAGTDASIQALVKEFYKTNFWYPLNLQLLYDQQLANAVYDFGVNAGIETSGKRLQKAANAVCGNLVVDGKVGPATIAQVNKLSGKAVYEQFNNLRKSYYDGIIASNPSQAEFRASWYSRIKPYVV